MPIILSFGVLFNMLLFWQAFIVYLLIWFTIRAITHRSPWRRKWLYLIVNKQTHSTSSTRFLSCRKQLWTFYYLFIVTSQSTSRLAARSHSFQIHSLRIPRRHQAISLSGTNKLACTAVTHAVPGSLTKSQYKLTGRILHPATEHKRSGSFVTSATSKNPKPKAR